jgi:hypothetical protein
VTAIGWCFLLDGAVVDSVLLDRSSEIAMEDALVRFRVTWETAHTILGHNLRRHDIKYLDGLAMGLGLQPLAKRTVIDTYLDLPKRKGVSFSLENAAERFGCPIQKIHMSEYAWERAYDGDPKYLPLMRERVETDVELNIWLYNYFCQKGWL